MFRRETASAGEAVRFSLASALDISESLKRTELDLALVNAEIERLDETLRDIGVEKWSEGFNSEEISLGDSCAEKCGATVERYDYTASALSAGGEKRGRDTTLEEYKHRDRKRVCTAGTSDKPETLRDRIGALVQIVWGEQQQQQQQQQQQRRRRTGECASD